ncbi:MAG: hypothetical protein HY081_03160 [Gammaproteobacteria bacterium]|nr:hypothetical protein [Gammaproteobacteria bacterium]
MKTQLTRGMKRRMMYVESKGNDIDGAHGRIGWVTFSKSGQTVYYRDKVLKKIKGGGISGNFYEEATGQEFWVSGIKKKGSNAHWAKSIKVIIDDDAVDEYKKLGRLG